MAASVVAAGVGVLYPEVKVQLEPERAELHLICTITYFHRGDYIFLLYGNDSMSILIG